jgi:hypothetical protein
MTSDADDVLPVGAVTGAATVRYQRRRKGAADG